MKNDLVLIVINDGNGDQCGLTYKQRCTATLDQLRHACNRANSWRIRHGCESATNEDIDEAAFAVHAYYFQHAIECNA